MAETIEREDLEVIEAPSESLQDEDVIHIACCQWSYFVARKLPHYAVCGVELLEQASSGEEPNCKVCIEIDDRARGHLCPMELFMRGEG